MSGDAHAAPHRAAYAARSSPILLVASGSLAATHGKDEVFSSVLVEAIATPSPVLGADDRVHLAYELLIVNPSGYLVTDRPPSRRSGRVSAVLAELAGMRSRG